VTGPTVRCSVTGTFYNDSPRDFVWPDDWPLPAKGDAVELPGEDNPRPLAVRAVTWRPLGDSGSPAPYVHLTIGYSGGVGLAAL
jgi:hypothetical protein